MSPSVEDDDKVWIHYLKEAEKVDSCLVGDWTKVIDNLLVFVGLFIGILTAFIIQISSNFQPNPAEVTNKILIAIYGNGTVNSLTPIDFAQFLKLDENSRRTYVLQNWLLYTSLILSILVAVLGMAAKLWVVGYSREVATSGPLRARVRRRQEVYDGSVEWALGKCIDTMPLISLIAVILFGFFIHSSISEKQQPGLAFLVSAFFHVGIVLFLIATFTAAFISNSPFHSLFSDLIKFIFRSFRVFPDEPVEIIALSPKPITVRWRTIAVVLIAVPLLAAGGYFLRNNNYIYFACIYIPVSLLGALVWDGKETDMRPRLITLPFWVLFSTITISASFLLAVQFSDRSTFLCLLFFALAAVLLVVQGSIGIKMTEKKPSTDAVEARAVSWLIQTSLIQKSAWFDKAAQIAKGSENIRGLLLKDLLPLLTSLIMGLDNGTNDRQTYIHTLATLLAFEPQERSFWRNQTALERPDLPEDLVKRLKELKEVIEKCPHTKEQVGNQEWCREGCIGDSLEHILLPDTGSAETRIDMK